MIWPVTLQTWLAFAGAVLVLNVTPGPDMMFVTATGLSRGPRAGVMAALGVGLGSAVHVLLATVGLATLLASAPNVLTGVRLAGAVFLLWLGYQAIRSPLGAHSASGDAPNLTAAFRGGVISTLLNPKRALVVFAFLPQFVSPEAGQHGLQVVILGLTMIAFELPFNMAYGASGGRLGRWLAERTSVRKLLAWLTGLAFFGLAARLALARPVSPG
jgi:threonine/homoserine/homoserine lactone efflux protein